MSKTENQSPQQGNLGMEQHNAPSPTKQNRSPQHLPHHNRPFLLPHQPFQYN